jgi:small-conductance mechanosensitive channel
MEPPKAGRWLILVAACLLVAGMLPVARAQDSIPIPTATAESAIEAVATPVAEGTPVVQTVISRAVSGILEMTAQNLLFLAISFLFVVLAVIYGSKLVEDLLRRLTKRTATTLDDTLLEALRPQIRWLIAAIGFQIVTVQLKFITGFWENALQATYLLLYWFVGMATVWRAIDYSAHWYTESLGPDIDPNLRDHLLPLARRLGHLFLLMFGIGILLAHFGVNLLSVAGVLGLTGFAISLAAKDTIINLVSGAVVMFDAPFTVGERIDLPALEVARDCAQRAGAGEQAAGRACGLILAETEKRT